MAAHCGVIPPPRGASIPWSAADLWEFARSLGLSGVEIPVRMVPAPGTPEMERLQAGDAGRVTVVLAAGVADEEDWPAALAAAGALGARTIRCLMSRALCGDRRSVPGGWAAHLDRQAAVLAGLAPLLRDAGVRVAVENHQDLTSDEILRLLDGLPDCVGVTLDTGNPLSVMEGPVEFAGRVASRLFHVHLKDYRVFASPLGFRLVRCPLGDGVVDLPGIVGVACRTGLETSLSLELAALQAREIPVTDPGWWDNLGPIGRERECEAWRTLLPDLRSGAEEYRTPLELGQDAAMLVEYERTQVERSARFLAHRVFGAGQVDG